MKDLNGKVAIVTGSGRGIGRAIAREFAANGMKVVCSARTQSQIDETVSLIKKAGGTAIAQKCDVTDRSEVEKLMQKTIDEFGQIDVLFNNAGSFSAIGTLWEVEPELWTQDVKVNLVGPMLSSRAALKYMFERDRGIIINMNGGGSAKPLTGGSSYGCSKAALLRLTDTLAAELEAIDSEIMVFAMGPGLVKTEMTKLQLGEQGQKWIPSTKESFERGRHHPPQDCAKATVKLLKIADKKLSGRVFDVGTDFKEIDRYKEQIKQKDLFTLRFRE
jgi:NAD(P)-dependent dehydrogenase (short-subunit alcohol dehydrogenase family)